jgi:hypothetical protein
MCVHAVAADGQADFHQWTCRLCKDRRWILSADTAALFSSLHRLVAAALDYLTSCEVMWVIGFRTKPSHRDSMLRLEKAKMSALG